MKTYYICGPISGRPNGNIEEFRRVARAYRADGNIAYIPHQIVPDPRSEAYAMRRCLTWICTAVEEGVDLTLVCLPDWEDSLGARVEVALARKLGVPVVVETP